MNILFGLFVFFIIATSQGGLSSEAIQKAVYTTGMYIQLVGVSLAQLITGHVSVADMAGPVGIIQMASVS